MLNASGIMMRIFILPLFLFFFIHANLTAQLVVSGVVYDKENKDPIQNANIYVNRHPYGTTSDEDGYFSFEVPSPQSQTWIVVIEHVAYDSLHIPIYKASELTKFALKPNSTTTDRIIVEAKAGSDLARELPVSVSIIDARRIESKGFVDAGDLLRTEQSIQIDENLSGKKTISLRGGNPEDVLVIYNGIRLNNNYNNIFDLSLINIEDIQRIEIIKGSNTALYGSEGLSGVINIIPKLYQTDKVRFIQKFGSYNSGDWSLQLNYNIFDRLYASYSQRRVGSQRKYGGSKDFLENESVGHTAHLIYDLSKNKGETGKNAISLMYLQNSLDYSNHRLLETVNDLNKIISLNYKGGIGVFNDFDLTASFYQLNNSQGFSTDSASTFRDISNDKVTFHIKKTTYLNPFFLTASYEYDKIQLNYNDQRVFLSEGQSTSGRLVYDRKKHGIVGLVGFDSDKKSDADKLMVSMSYRFDIIDDARKDRNEAALFDSQFVNLNRTWQGGMFKASFRLTMEFKDIEYVFSANTGTNIRYPTLFNQLSTPVQFDDDPSISSTLAPEKNRSMEGSVALTGEKTNNDNLDYWKIKVTIFKNMYENKFRSFYSLSSPFAYFDNVKNADLSGVESRVELSFFKNALILEGGISSFDISDKAAFPLKSDLKYVANLYFEKWDYNVQVNWFKMGKQVGWFRGMGNGFTQQVLPGFMNLNIHAGKEWALYNLKLKLNFSAVNLLSDPVKFNGLAIHDRRMYVGLEIKY